MGKLIGTTVHEIIHMQTGFLDCTRDFENALTDKVGNYMIDCTHLSLFGKRKLSL